MIDTDKYALLIEVKGLRERLKTEHNLKLWEKSEVKRLRDELDTIKSHRSFEHRFSPTAYGMAIEAWIGLTESGNGLWNDDKRSAFDDLRLLTEEEWWQWQEEDIDWPWHHDEIIDALDDAHHAYLCKCIDTLKIEGGIMALKKKLQESEEE